MLIKDLEKIFDFFDCDYKIVEYDTRKTLVDSKKPGFWLFLDYQNEYKKYLDREIYYVYPRKSGELKIIIK